MTRFSTIDPPAAISFFTPAGGFAQDQLAYSMVATNARSDVSLIEARIRSAFESAGKELRRYERYSPQWDGYRAQPFTPEVLDHAAGNVHGFIRGVVEQLNIKFFVRIFDPANGLQ